MYWRLERTLFWITVGLVSIALLLAVAVEESPSPNVRTKILQWHEWIGLLSLPSLAAALAARWFDRHHHLLPLPHWLPWLRRGLEISLSFFFYFSHYRDGCLQAIRESSPQSSGGPSRLLLLRTHASYTARVLHACAPARGL